MSNWFARSIALTLLTALALGCSGGGKGGAAATTDGGVSAIIGPSGGEVVLGSMVLDVPAGALGAVVTITASVDPSGPPPGFVASSPVYRFLPEGLNFAVPATVRMGTDGSLPMASVYWSQPSEAGFEALPTTWVDTTATALVTHFSGGFVGAPSSDTDGAAPADDAGSADATPADEGPTSPSSDGGLGESSTDGAAAADATATPQGAGDGGAAPPTDAGSSNSDVDGGADASGVDSGAGPDAGPSPQPIVITGSLTFVPPDGGTNADAAVGSWDPIVISGSVTGTAPTGVTYIVVDVTVDNFDPLAPNCNYPASPSYIPVDYYESFPVSLPLSYSIAVPPPYDDNGLCTTTTRRILVNVYGSNFAGLGSGTPLNQPISCGWISISTYSPNYATCNDL